MHPLLEPWSDFNVGVAGASAALAGLIIVAVSVNLERIIAAPVIPARTGAAIGALTLAVVASCLALIPDHSLFLLGLEILFGGLVTLWFGLLATVRIYRATTNPDPTMPKPPRMWPPAKIGMCLAAPTLFLVGGGVLLTGNPNGLNWVAAGSLTAIVAGVGFSWIVLIEVRR